MMLFVYICNILKSRDHIHAYPYLRVLRNYTIYVYTKYKCTIYTIENCVHCLRCVMPFFYIGDCRVCTSFRGCLSNDFVRLLSETSVTYFNIISFFLLQRSLSSHGSSHLFSVTSKFCNRVKALLLTCFYVMQLYDPFCCLSL